MRTPPLLLGGALLLWAWQTGLWWIALPLALALEGSRFSSIRWNFDQTDLNRLWNLCVVAFAGCTVYLLASAEDGLGLAAAVAGSRRNPASAERAGLAFRHLTQWFPLCTAPMILAAAWGRLETLPVSTFSWYLQKRRPDITTTIRIDWTYLILVVAGASAGDTSPAFVPVLVAYFGWLLWTRRNPGYRPVWFAVGFSLAAAAALLGHRPLQPAAAWWRDMESRVLSRLFQRDANPSESRTSIGRIGVGKGSGAVAFRIESDPTNPPVELLRDAIYSSYRRTVWQNPTGADFGDLTPSTLEGAFVVGPETNGLASLRLWLQPGRRRLLPTPPGLQVIDPVPADLLATNALGMFLLTDLTFAPVTLHHGTTPRPLPPPSEVDLTLPDSETAVLRKVAEECGLVAGSSATEVRRRLERFFLERFEYALYRGIDRRAGPTNSTLESFLLTNRRGHCEYFATATTLLFRQAGIPARYVVGWAVPDREGGSRWIPVRQRHAHAWTLAWIDGAWRDVDTTPPSWSEIESKESAWWQPIQDLFQRTVFEWNRLRNGLSSPQRWLFGAIGLVACWLLFQVLRRRNWRGGKTGKGPDTGPAQGSDSEFYEVVRQLEREGHERRRGETLESWLHRIERSHPGRTASVLPLLRLHYRLRFDPAGLPEPSRRTLREATGDWMLQLRRSRTRRPDADSAAKTP